MWGLFMCAILITNVVSMRANPSETKICIQAASHISTMASNTSSTSMIHNLGCLNLSIWAMGGLVSLMGAMIFTKRKDMLDKQ